MISNLCPKCGKPVHKTVDRETGKIEIICDFCEIFREYGDGDKEN